MCTKKRLFQERQHPFLNKSIQEEADGHGRNIITAFWLR